MTTVTRGVPVWCGGMHEFGIGRAANVAIASLPGFTLPGDVSGSDKYYRRDIVSPPILAVEGAIAVPGSPGIGVEPVLDEIKAHDARAPRRCTSRRELTRSCMIFRF